MVDDFVARLFAAWTAHDPDKVVEFCTDDILFEDVPLGATLRGKNEVRAFVTRTFARVPDLKVDVVTSFVTDAHGVPETVWSGTDRGILNTGKLISIRVASVFDLHRGKMSRNVDYWDFNSLMRQAGVPPPMRTGGN
jgi:limonene-1,2-epoxide hydrolase